VKFQDKILLAVLLLMPLLLFAIGDSYAVEEAAAAESFFSRKLVELLLNPFFSLFLVLSAGLLLGKIKISGISLGSSGVLFVALLAGHFGQTVPGGVGKLGLVLFVYCVGITAGPTFFSALRQRGGDLAKLSFVAVISGALMAYLAAHFLKISPGLAAGLYAGALTSTPGLAAAMDALGEHAELASIGYGIAYPFGVIGVVIFVQLIPRFFQNPVDKENSEKAVGQHDQNLVRALVKVENGNLKGLNLDELADAYPEADFCVSRTLQLQDKVLVPIKHESECDIGQVLFLVAKDEELSGMISFIGHEYEEKVHIDADNERMQVVVTAKALTGKNLEELYTLAHHGIVVSRITRDGMTFLATPDTIIEYGDVLTVVGLPEQIKGFAKFAGHWEKALHQTDLLTLFAGLVLGVILGMVPIGIPCVKVFKLGMAGGPLFVALLLGHFRRTGWVSGYLPRASRLMMMELGLTFFLASAGIKAGAKIMPVLQEHGIMLFLSGAAITIVPMLITFLVARYILKIELLASLGGICGGMTSTPALGALTAKIDSNLPVISYAAAYPIALILMTILTQILVMVLK